MGRSVSYPSDAVFVVYAKAPDEADAYDNFEFELAMEQLQEQLQDKYPSFEGVDKWVDREDRAFLENRLVQVGVSEYCGLLAFWVRPSCDEEMEPLAYRFAEQIENRVKSEVKDYFGGIYEKQGSFSNGEGVYRKVA